MSQFDRHLFRQLWTLAKPFFVGEQRVRALTLFALLLVFVLSIKGLDVWMSYIGRDFMTALNIRDSDEFVRQLSFYLLAFAITTPVQVFYRYTEERLALMWRRWLSQRMIQRYFSNQSYYRLGWHPGIDNPDQRIEEDTRSFTGTSLSLFLILLQSIISLFAFTVLLSSISWYLTLAAVVYASFGSICTYFLGRPLIGLNYAQLKKEADYRYKLINVRDNAESVAFYRGEAREAIRVRQKLKDVLRNMLRIINRNRLLNFFTTGYNYINIILPTVIIAPSYLRGEIEFGVVTQAAMAFGQVLNALSIIVLNFGSLSNYAAVVRRLGLFWEALDETSAEPVSNSAERIVSVQEDRIAVENVTIRTPAADQVLLDKISFCVPEGGLFITGESGTGKSSILRVLSGLWTFGSGTVYRPPLEQAIFVPQRPYMVMGTLRAQLVYGLRRANVRDRELYDALDRVGLRETCERIGGLDATVDWSNILSTGEQQRLAFARIVIVRPRYVFLDEATTALDEEGEKRLYTVVKDFTQLYVSVGYRQTLQNYHRQMLVLSGKGRWRIEELPR